MGLIGDIFNHFSDKAERQDQMAYDAYLKQEERDYNEKMTAQDRGWQLYLWNLQNEYNNPINQRKRLEAAGINPVLAFGSQASSMSAPIGSPITGRSTSNEGRSQRYFEKASQLASIAAMRENARREKNNNDLFEYLLNDKKLHDSLKLKSDIVEYEWNLQHKAEALDEDLLDKQLGNKLRRQDIRLRKVQVDLENAKANGEWVRYSMLKREKEHLEKKYAFEDNYYSMGLNPYETSTVAGAMRTIAGVTGTGLNYMLPFSDNPIWQYDKRMAKFWWKKDKEAMKLWWKHKFDRY